MLSKLRKRMAKSVVDAAIGAAASAFNVDADDLRGPRRHRHLVVPRLVSMGMLLRAGGAVWSTAEIGRQFRRDHTTVIHADRGYLKICKALGLNPVAADFDEQAKAIAQHYYVPPSRGVQLDQAAAAEALAERQAADLEPAVEVVVETEVDRIATPADDLVDFDPDFGAFRISAEEWRGLPDAMQTDAALLAAERFGSVEAASKVVGILPDVMAQATRKLARGRPYCVPALDERQWTQAIGLGGGAEVLAPRTKDPAPPVEGGFLPFAQIHLSGEGSLDVRAAYATYQAFCAGRGCVPLPRATFGASLLAMARGHGGARSGDTIEGLSLRGGKAAPPALALQFCAAPVRPPRAPIALGVMAARRGRKIIEIGEDGERYERREGAL